MAFRSFRFFELHLFLRPPMLRLTTRLLDGRFFLVMTSRGYSNENDKRESTTVASKLCNLEPLLNFGI